MLKWLLVLFIAFLSLWVVNVNYIPDEIRFSTFGSYMNSALFNIRYELMLKRKDQEPRIQSTEVDQMKFKNFLNALDSQNSKAVILLYNSSSFFSKTAINNVNQLITNHADDKSIYYVVIAFDNNKRKVDALLSEGYKEIKFKPLIMRMEDMNLAANLFSKNGVGFSRTPELIYRNGPRGYEIYSPDYTSFDEIDKKLSEKPQQ